MNEIEDAAAKRRPKITMRISTKISLIFGLFFLTLGVITIVTTILVSNHTFNMRAKAAIDDTFVLIGSAASSDTLNVLDSYLDASGYRVSVTHGSEAWNNDGDVAVPERNYAKDKGRMSARFEKDGYTIVIEYNLAIAQNMMLVERIVMAVCILVSAGVVLLGGSFVAQAMLKPIRKITETTRTITKESLDVRIRTEETQTELTDLAEVINNMLDNLQVTLESQERFVSDASHEMRTPIAVIKGYASMLQRWGTTDPAILSEGIEAISKEVVNMQALIDNLLFLSRTDREVLTVKFEPFALSELVDEAMRDSEIVDTDHIYVRGRMEVTDVSASREMVKQLLRIITDNAKKYTPKGGTVTLECYSDGRFAVMRVHDQGIGIAKKDLDHVFERFYRADKARNREGGSGLGMSIAKKIADLHGGEIVLESKVGEGTIATVYLPKTHEELE